MNPADPNNIIVTYRERRMAAEPATNPVDEALGRYGPGHMLITVATSFDGGGNWTRSSLPHAGNAPPGTAWSVFCTTSRNNVHFDASGRAYLIGFGIDCASNIAGQVFLVVSDDGGLTWTEPSFVPGAATAVGMYTKSSVEPTTGAIAIAWEDAGVEVAVTDDGGATWTTHIVDRSELPDTGYAAFPTWGTDGSLHVAYNSAACGAVCVKVGSTSDPFKAGASWSVAEVARTTPRFGDDLRNTQELDPSMATDHSNGEHNGRVYLSYIDAPNGDDDVWLVWSDDGAATWSEPMPLNDNPADGSDQFHHWMAVDDRGIVWASFFDRRVDPANLNLTTTLARFEPGTGALGNTLLGESREPGWCQNPPPARENCWTHSDGMDAAGGTVVIAWTQGTPLKPDQEAWSEGQEGNQDRDVLVAVIHE